MRKILMINPEKCTGCRLCELACSLKKVGEFNPLKSRISMVVFPEELAYVPITCLQCDEAACMEVCPSNALYRDEKTGAVYLNKERCVGCKMCIMACPFGDVGYDPLEQKINKCDFCEGEPECVKFCLPGALEYREADEIVLNKRKAVAQRMRELFKEVAL